MLVVAPEDKRISQDILIPPNAQGKAKVGQVVSVEIVEYPDRYVQPVGRVVEVLGDIDDPGMEIEIAVRKYGVPHAFSAAAAAEAAALPDTVQPSDLQHRIDLRDVPLVTIDGEDARDFDDAVYCEPVKIGRSKGWRLIVAIADVSHYVRARHAARHRRARPRHLGLLPAPRDPDAAGEAVQRPVLPEPAGGPPVHGVRRGHHRQGRDQGLPVLSRGDALGRAPDLQRGLGRAVEHQGARSPQARRAGAPAAGPVRAVPGAARPARAVRSTSTPPRPISSAMRRARSSRSCRVPATMRTA